MAKLNSVEFELLLAYVDDIANGEIYKPFFADKTMSSQTKLLVGKLDDLRKEVLLWRSDRDKNSATVHQEIANVTHDLKTPLAVIMGAVECLEDGIDEHDYVGLIKEKANEMNETVFRIIDSSRAIANNEKNEKRIIDARDIFVNIHAKYKDLAEGKHLKFIVKRIPKALIAVSEKEIMSVMDNLLTNALKYTQSGKIWVSFRANKKYFLISVKDTGKGIRKVDLPHVFDRFYTEDKARTHDGTGIGLSYVKEVVEAHGGNISIRSAEDKGSKFIIALPRVEPKRVLRMSDNKKKYIEATLRFYFFPFFLPIDFCRSIYYHIKYIKNKFDYYIAKEN